MEHLPCPKDLPNKKVNEPGAMTKSGTWETRSEANYPLLQITNMCVMTFNWSPRMLWPSTDVDPLTCQDLE